MLTTKYNFTKISPSEFENWLSGVNLSRTVLKVQQHHTYIPSYQLFNGSNHFELQRGMRNTHIDIFRWADIAQHFTIFPDGQILTGRSLEMNPAGIVGQNANAICIENLGFFDKGKDDMTQAQKDAIVTVTALLCKKFNLPIDTKSIIYHHWYSAKTCPGTNFFGGNRREDCEKHFLPLVKNVAPQKPKEDDDRIKAYAIVTALMLNVRTGPGVSHAISSERAPVERTNILRVYDEKNGWLKISASKPLWVSGKFTKNVQRYVVEAPMLNVRSGPAMRYYTIGQVHQGESVFISEEKGIWRRMALEDKWVSANFLKAF